MRALERQPQFLGILWDATEEETLEAMLCLQHRLEIAAKYAEVRGHGQMGESCDLCDGREPRKVSGGAMP